MQAMKKLKPIVAISSSVVIGTSCLLGNSPASAIPAWSKYCGPESNPGASKIWNGLLYPWSRLFDSSCRDHDNNYTKANRNEAGMTQARADNLFRNDMQRKCNQNWRSAVRLNGTGGDIAYTIAQIFSLGTFGEAMRLWCLGAAESNYQMVTTLGEDVGAVRGFPSIEVTQARIKRIDDWLGDDEIEINFTVRNNGNVNVEVDAVMMKKGKGYRQLVRPSTLGQISTAFNSDIIDAEPDTYEVDLNSGQQWSDKLSTNGVYASQENLDNPVNVYIRADLYNPGGNFTAPFVPMAWLQCTKPKAGKSGPCKIKYRFGDGWSEISVRQSAEAWLKSVRSSKPNTSPATSETGGTPSSADKACANKRTNMGIWSFRNPKSNKYVRGGVTAEGRKDVVGALAPRVANPLKAWETFRLYSIPGVSGGRRLLNTIDGRWLETVNKTNTLLLPSKRRCTTSNKDMQWRVVNVKGQSGIYKLQNRRNGKFVRVTTNGLLKANASETQATPFSWKKY